MRRGREKGSRGKEESRVVYECADSFGDGKSEAEEESPLGFLRLKILDFQTVHCWSLERVVGGRLFLLVVKGVAFTLDLAS